MRKFLLVTLLFCLISSFADAQAKRRKSTFNRKKPPYKYELIGAIGGTNFLGELGGADRIGTNGLRDLELVLTRPSLSFGVRYKVAPYFSAKGNLYWGMIRGDDKLTAESFRNNRNLNFKSPLLELSAQLEFNFMREQKGHVYKIRGIRGMKHKDRQMYLFGGGGFVYFNPKGKYDGKWYPLRPLRTEGQASKYSPLTPIISVGGGIRFAINRYWGLGFELGMRKTFTDYLDDVSTEYPDPAIFSDPVAVHFSNPAKDPGGNYPYGGCQTCVGQQRGDKHDKDAYMFAAFTVGYKVMYRKRSRSKF